MEVDYAVYRETAGGTTEEPNGVPRPDSVLSGDDEMSGGSGGDGEQDTSDTSDKVDDKSIKKPFSEDFVNNNKEKDFIAKSWAINPVHRMEVEQRRRGSEEDSAREDSEEKMSESEESSPRSEERDVNMNTGSFNGLKLAAAGLDNPLSEQLKSVTDRISALVAEAGSTDNPKTMQDLAVLQTTLFTLQQQQILQMQILAHMQSQMKGEHQGAGQPEASVQPQKPVLEPANNSPLFRLQEMGKERGGGGEGGLPDASSSLRSLQNLISSDPHTTDASKEAYPSAPRPNSGLPSELSHPEQVQGGDMSSLELLQHKAQGILNNASHGLLKNSLADLSYNKNVSKDDPHFKHRCKFCGKVFGSDSALQIHIRSVLNFSLDFIKKCIVFLIFLSPKDF